ncbi:hypothetical protein LX12_004239 [Williamsia serinedens]|uniref:DUF6036 domain-containing protein n=1 Tax=Williamsia serinedens TaxID=391736 RepID=A0ABT1H719_9NOCA|nr:hypothetical protein [Williamsia serinedens]
MIVVGSQAILGSYEAAALPAALSFSGEMDATPELQFIGAAPSEVEEAISRINVAVGEDSDFHNENGFYVEGISMRTLILAKGWENRLESYEITGPEGEREQAGWCLSPVDICVSKALAGRPNDVEYVIALVRSNLIDVDEVLARVTGRLDWGDHEPDERRIERAVRLVESAR